MPGEVPFPYVKAVPTPALHPFQLPMSQEKELPQSGSWCYTKMRGIKLTTIVSNYSCTYPLVLSCTDSEVTANLSIPRGKHVHRHKVGLCSLKRSGCSLCYIYTCETQANCWLANGLFSTPRQHDCLKWLPTGESLTFTRRRHRTTWCHSLLPYVLYLDSIP